MKNLLVVTLALLLAGCGPKVSPKAETAEQSDLPKGWTSYSGVGGFNRVYVVPHTMDDGAQCVILFGDSRVGALSCNWPQK